MEKILLTMTVLLIAFSLCACGPKTETVEITLDNWDEFFEFRTVTRWEENAFGETSMVEYPLALCVKEEYVDRIIMDQANLAIECSWVENYRVVDIDWENRTVHFGDIDKSYDDIQTRTDAVTEILCWESYENAYIVVYIRDLGVSEESLMLDGNGNAIAISLEDGNVIRIQGTIVVKEG